jgi:integrase
VPRLVLTDRFVAGVRATERADYFDEKTPGLALRVSAGRHKAWTFHFTSPKDGKRARLTLGAFPASSLAAARARAIEARGYLQGQPPRDPRDVMAQHEAGAMTVSDMIRSYLEKHVSGKLRSEDEKERRFAKNITPIIGLVKLADLHRRDVNRVIDPILQRGSPVEAARCFEDLRAVLRWAVARGDIDRNPMEGMRKPGASQARDRVLSDTEIQTLWNVLPKALARSKACQRIVKLCLVTAQRVGEVAGMTLDELDLKHAMWTIPGSRTKNGHKHSVPLSGLAVELIHEALAGAGKGAQYVFPRPDGSSALPAEAVARTIGRAHEQTDEQPNGRFGIPHWTTHDLRRTAVSNMAQLGIAPIVLGHVINHRSVTKAGVTLAVYSHYDYAREKRAALELWAERLTAIVSGSAATVMPISQRKAKP